MKTTDHVTDHVTDHACDVSLIEQLKSVPLDSREWIKDENGSGLINIPYGRYCKEAVAELQKLEAEVERLRGQLTRAVSIAGVLLADIEDFRQGDSDDEWTRNGWNDSRISKYLLRGLREEIK